MRSVQGYRRSSVKGRRSPWRRLSGQGRRSSTHSREESFDADEVFEETDEGQEVANASEVEDRTTDEVTSTSEPWMWARHYHHTHHQHTCDLPSCKLHLKECGTLLEGEQAVERMLGVCVLFFEFQSISRVNLPLFTGGIRVFFSKEETSKVTRSSSRICWTFW